LRLTPDGVSTVFASSISGLNDPCGLAFDSAGYLYVANESNNNIERFDASGVGTLFASSGMNEPNFIAFQPIPEPRAWVLLAWGLALFSRMVASTREILFRSISSG